MATRWVQDGADVVLVTTASLLEDGYALDPRVHRIALDAARNSGSLWDAMKNNLDRLRLLRRILRDERPDVALAVMSTSSVQLAIAGWGLTLVRIGSEHRQPDRASLGRSWNFLCRHSYRLLDAVVALTPEGADWIMRHTSARRVPVIPNSVSLPLRDEAPAISPDSVGSNACKRLLAVGRLTPVKGFTTLLAAYAKIAFQHEDWELVIVGTGPDRAMLEHRIAQLGLQGRVWLPGRVGNMADWYRSAHLFVSASLHEAFPMALLEAMAHGLPTVAFDCEAGPRNIIRHGVDGLLAPPGNSVALAENLARLMANDEMRIFLGSHAIEVTSRFSEENIHAMWQRLFQELIHARNT